VENLILLDTGMVLDFFCGRPSAEDTEKILAESRAALSVITVFELFFGVTEPKHLRQREQLISLCEVVEITRTLARRAAEIGTRLRGQGRTVDNEDLLIAASAIGKSYPLLTTNPKHFTGIPGLVIHS
jgi:tRNA(fMet)-specific endonuclease VapC